MVTVIFYEKSGCSGNARQKALLEAAGHELVVRDLRQVKWTRARLLGFFDGLPVAHWFNRNAPAVKCGDIVPEQIDEPTALGLMQHDPLLIRRPLIEVDGVRKVGFDATAIDAWIGINGMAAAGDLEACSHADPAHRCHDPLTA